MPRMDKVAARYAKAIHDSTGKEVKHVLKELESFAKATTSHHELNQIFSSSVFPPEQRRAVVEDLLKKIKVSEETKRILLVLSDMKRLSGLTAITESLHLMLLHEADVVPLRVEAAADLTADEKDKVEKKFSKILGKKVEASYVVDPGVLAGLKVTANGRTFDGTIAGWLSTFEERLAEGSR